MSMVISIKKCRESAIIPTLGSEHAGAYDLYTADDFKLEYGMNIVPTGLKMALPEGYRAIIKPRSGVEVKGMPCMHDYIWGERVQVAKVKDGVIDSDYRGEVNIIVEHESYHAAVIRSGTRIAQMLIEKVEYADFLEVEDLDKTERGEGGFGHSGV